MLQTDTSQQVTKDLLWYSGIHIL